MDLEIVVMRQKNDSLNAAFIEELTSHLYPMEKELMYEIYYLGKTEKEVAAENNIGESTVKNYHRRALLKMNSVLRKQELDKNIVDIFNPVIFSREEFIKNEIRNKNS